MKSEQRSHHISINLISLAKFGDAFLVLTHNNKASSMQRWNLWPRQARVRQSKMCAVCARWCLRFGMAGLLGVSLKHELMQPSPCKQTVQPTNGVQKSLFKRMAQPTWQGQLCS